MKRLALILCFALAGVVLSPRPAQAGGIWAWLEEWSGPGPFKGWAYVLTACVQGQIFKPSPIATSRDDQQKLPCVYYDQAFYDADVDTKKGFPALKVNFWDIGPSVRLFDWLDIGAGVGRISFTPKDTSDTHARFGFTPVRVVVRPLLLLPLERKQWMGILSVYVKETFFNGPFVGSDFGAPANPFSSAGELKTSAGITFDFSSLVTKWK